MKCTFFQQGRCRFGNQCKNEHDQDSSRQTQNRGNPFSPLGNDANQDKYAKYRINHENVRVDLQQESPSWILSAYGPGRDAPEQLFGGYPREQSFEELRLHYYVSEANGQGQAAIQQAQELYKNAEEQMKTAATNITEACNFIVAAEDKHPNRHDICQQFSTGAPFGVFEVGKQRAANAGGQAPVNPFATGNAPPSSFGAAGAQAGASPFATTGNAPAGSSGSGFGQTSSLGQQANPFGSASGGSTFGQPSQSTSTFGQPSQLGAKVNPFAGAAPASRFGQASAPPATGASGFGQPSQLGAQPSPFAAASGSTFGQPSQQANQASPFGQASAPPAAQASPFGQASTTPASSPFGQTNQANAGGSGFGQVGQLGAKVNPFAPTSTAPATNTAPSPFATTTSQQPQDQNRVNPFGQASSQQTAANPFAATSSNQASNTPFGQPSQLGAKPSPFAATTTQTNTNNNAINPFSSQASTGASAAAQPATTTAPANPYPPGSARQHPPLESYTTKTATGRLNTFRNNQVTYNEQNQPGYVTPSGAWTKIWFPDGPPGFNKDTMLDMEAYDEDSKKQWKAFAETGEFEGGVMPELPPPRDCVLWNF
ncbi:uncharacterized protein F5Z01DRAFT_664425 [Emericellopsis atlantica]|uniref:C3H1-type domain-containing protein n=1 Tax=Emericellopsis atlantica TaxID=2614577 RepID=A0A9P7ZF83_9HYPO|nr:uncharacterized protein F5Z01DRAFT_664425 [Emericellopsis atlantica]KAG9251018.1 hypothetical protein F5Z01DRAFT_664425 [Emericellopsis atlantica]